jgi:hypothetical protein
MIVFSLARKNKQSAVSTQQSAKAKPTKPLVYRKGR